MGLKGEALHGVQGQSPWSRHDLLWLRPDGWDRLLSSRPDLAARPALLAWRERGDPVMRRRRLPGDDPSALPAGLPLPCRERLAFTVGRHDIDRTMPPTALADLALPAGWAAPVRDIVSLGERLGLVARVFGGLLWQSLTGLSYLRPGSDLDLLWRVPRGPETPMIVSSLVAALAQSDRRAPTIDGEIAVEGVGAVQWREFAGASSSDEVLVKTEERVLVMTRDELMRAAGAC